MSPNLKEYDEALVKHVLEHGKKGALGRMPSFKTMLTPVQEKAVTEFIKSIKE
jgi:cytochrome c oxidase cbb3-type subunit 3